MHSRLRIEQDPRTSYTDVKREQDVLPRAVAGDVRLHPRTSGLVVTVIFSVGAMIGAMITMYAAVANRTREIGTLRALGFRRRSVLSAFLIESILLSFIGGMVGVGAGLVHVAGEDLDHELRHVLRTGVRLRTCAGHHRVDALLRGHHGDRGRVPAGGAGVTVEHPCALRRLRSREKGHLDR